MASTPIFRFMLILCLSLVNVACASLPKDQSVPGGIAVIPLPNNAQNHWKAYYNQKRCLVVSRHHQDYAIVGIPLSTEKGTQKIVAKNNQQTIQIPFQVNPTKYPAQYITLKVSRHPSKKKFNWERFKREKALIAELYKYWRDNDSINTHFILPVKGRISGPFGFQRYFNGEKCAPHGGVDIAAKKGTRIHAPADAVVLNTGKYYLCGKAIFLDHGQNVISVFCHLNKILVTEGQTVKQGQTIGLVGQTGRATGPHLHWGVSLNETHINPLLMVK